MFKKLFKKLPLMPWRYDRRRKIKSQKTVDKINELRNSGWSLSRLAKKFKVSIPTIVYWTDENFRENEIAKSQRNMSFKRQLNPEHYVELDTQSRKYKLRMMPKIKKHYASGLPQNA